MRHRTRLYQQLNRFFGTPVAVDDATYTRHEEIFATSTSKFLALIRPHVDAATRVLIVGCGQGAEIGWFAERCAEVVATDVSKRLVERATAVAARFPNVQCLTVDGRTLPFESDSFDLVFMHDVCEHIIHVEACFAEYYRVLKPAAVLANSFAPLFYSPYGAHLQDALKMPWGHLLFGVEAVVELRNMYYPSPSKARTWSELGLNRITERRYRRMVDALGFRHEHYEVRASKNLPLVAHMPGLRNLFILQVTDILRKP